MPPKKSSQPSRASPKKTKGKRRKTRSYVDFVAEQADDLAAVGDESAVSTSTFQPAVVREAAVVTQVAAEVHAPPGDVPSDVPGDAPGDVPGDAPGDAPRDASRDAPRGEVAAETGDEDASAYPHPQTTVGKGKGQKGKANNPKQDFSLEVEQEERLLEWMAEHEEVWRRGHRLYKKRREISGAKAAELGVTMDHIMGW
ncbi:hypothetical protein ACF0H5_019403 [Mactra antiquata]